MAAEAAAGAAAAGVSACRSTLVSELMFEMVSVLASALALECWMVPALAWLSELALGAASASALVGKSALVSARGSSVVASRYVAAKWQSSEQYGDIIFQ